ncbi:enoyl-CoA hydratase/isomerase family protein [Desulfosporosinus fructosivorans]|uniref:Enoyl-CoA hydratase/isomerase family protein n=1 Tax=Desulfosporosinus fructosivorans TaxID=2018669 RepID=A0A4Z0R348_9FIRM|nr:enoyl-CoA hydratase/isomerase family protein [Desulfosporosinus fructosivorans]TGE37024.1 enoyl-CoA hydratase/isomerase family protein [Desulfosporosinus fructosivorans]
MYPYEKKYDHVVKIEKENQIATITFDSPENLNRLSEQVIDEFGAALDNAQWDHDIRAIILRGTGDISFGPGDIEIIKTKLAKNLALGREIMYEIANLIKKMYTISKPIIGLAEAGCLGGGCNLLLSSDIVIASEKAYFHELFVNYALTPDTGGLWALQRLVGPMKAKAITMCGEPVGAQLALEMGMVYKVVPADKAYEEAYALAKVITSKSPVGINHIKQISNRLHDYSMDTYFQVEGDYLTLGALSEDFKETNLAAMQKRAPQYKGY